MKKIEEIPGMISRYRTELMGFAAVWIMLFHSAIPASENVVLRLLWYVAIGFGGGLGVNVFVFLSGYGLMFSHSKSSCCSDAASVRMFLARRVKRLLIPYLLVAGIYFAARCLHAQAGLLTFLEDITLLSFVTKGDRTYWYIFAALVLYFLYPLYMWIAQKYGQGRTCAVTLLGLILLEVAMETCSGTLYARFEVVILRMPLFFLGSYFAAVTMDKPYGKRSWCVFGGVAVLAVVCFLGYAVVFLNHIGGLRLQRYLFIPISVGVSAVLPCIFHRVRMCNRFLHFCGKNSLGIYLIHIPLYRLAALVGVKAWNPYVECLGVMAVSILLAAGLSCIVERIQLCKLLSKGKGESVN